MFDLRTLSELFATLPVDAWLLISAGVMGLVAVASLFKYLSVSGGGRTVAESLGGRLIHQSTNDPTQRRLLNVVEEMAIAATLDCPLPPSIYHSQGSRTESALTVVYD